MTTLALSFLIGSSLFLQVTLGYIRIRTTELAAIERLNKSL